MRVATRPGAAARLVGHAGLRHCSHALLAGLMGTTAMTASLWAEKKARRAPGPVDYDASSHVVTAAANALRWHPDSTAERRALFLTVHWGYGSAAALAYLPIRRVVRSDARSGAAFFLICQGMAMTLFPTLGDTPPPWRWPRDVLCSSLAQHALYAAVVTAALRRTSGPGRDDGRIRPVRRDA